MNAQHTPGPWSMELDIPSDGDINVFANEMEAIAMVDVRSPEEALDGHGIPREQALANGRLITAAPELLGMLRKLILAVKAAPSARAAIGPIAAEAALAVCKAEGTTEFAELLAEAEDRP